MKLGSTNKWDARFFFILNTLDFLILEKRNLESSVEKIKGNNTILDFKLKFILAIDGNI